MKKFFTSHYSPFVLIVAGIVIGLSMMPERLQQVAATVGMTGLVLGMTKQAIMQYRSGKSGIHWMLNTIMLFAIVLRGVYLVRTGQYWLAIPDVYGALMMGILQLHLAGHLLKKLTN